MANIFSYDQFVSAARDLSAAHITPTYRYGIELDSHLTGWEWKQYRGIGWLAKAIDRTMHGSPSMEPSKPNDELLEELDEATLLPQPQYAATISRSIRIDYHIVFSRTYLVPQLCLTAHDQFTGSASSLSEIITPGILRPPSPTQTSSINSTFQISLPSSPFPLLLQMDHPGTNEVVWAIHPCETRNMVDEIMKNDAERQGGLDVEWMKAWLMVCSSLVDLKV